MPELAALPGVKTTRYRPDSPDSAWRLPAVAGLSCMVRLPVVEAFSAGLSGGCSTHATATIAPMTAANLKTLFCIVGSEEDCMLKLARVWTGCKHGLRLDP